MINIYERITKKKHTNIIKKLIIFLIGNQIGRLEVTAGYFRSVKKEKHCNVGKSIDIILFVYEGKSTCRIRSYKDQSHIEIIQHVGLVTSVVLSKYELNPSINEKVMTIKAK